MLAGILRFFSRMFLTMPGVGEVDFFNLFYGTEIRRCHTDNFLAGFDPSQNWPKTAIQKILFGYIDHFGERLHGIMMKELYPDIKFEQISRY